MQKPASVCFLISGSRQDLLDEAAAKLKQDRRKKQRTFKTDYCCKSEWIASATLAVQRNFELDQTWFQIRYPEVLAIAPCSVETNGTHFKNMWFNPR